MVWVCYSSSLTCVPFVAALLRLLLFVVLCHLLLWWHKTTPGWFYLPEGRVFNRGGGGCIPQKGWLWGSVSALGIFFDLCPTGDLLGGALRAVHMQCNYLDL